MSPRPRQLVVIGAMYTAQGFVHGLGLLMLGMLAAAGVALDEVAPVLVAGALPWVVKIGWAALLDLRTRARPLRSRRWCAAGQLGTAFGLTALALAVGPLLGGEGSPALVATLWFATNAALALQDAATDALTLDELAPMDRDHAGLAAQIGQIVGAGVLVTGLLYYLAGEATPSWGLPALLRLAAALSLALAPLPLFFPAGSEGPPARHPIGDALAEVAADRRVWAGLALALVVGLPGPLGSSVAQHFLMQSLGWPLSDVLAFARFGTVIAALTLLGLLPLLRSLPGAARGGALARAGPATAGAFVLALAHLIFALSPGLWTRAGTFYALGAAEAVGAGLLMAGSYARLMDLTHPTFRALHFTAWMSLLNVGRLVGPWAGAKIAGAAGYPAVYLAAAGLYALTIPWLWVLGRSPPAFLTGSGATVDKGTAAA